jgi:hypothetical protein
MSAFMVAIGGKADIAFCGAYVRWCDPAKNLFAGAKRSGSQNNGGKKQVEVASCV